MDPPLRPRRLKGAGGESGKEVGGEGVDREVLAGRYAIIHRLIASIEILIDTCR